MSQKTIAIIGSNGVLGSDLVQFLTPKYKIIPITRENYLHSQVINCDILINANGNSKRFWANNHILEDFAASTISVYRSLLDFHYKKYIYISSSDVYEDHSSPSTTREEKKINPDKLSPYGFHKYLSEEIVRHHAANYLILRSCMILGNNLRKGPIYDLMHDQPLFITLNSKLQMINTKAIAAVIDHFIENNISNQIFNMAGKGAFSFQNIDKMMNKKISISEKAETQEYEMNVTKLAKLILLKKSEQYLKEYLAIIK